MRPGLGTATDNLHPRAYFFEIHPMALLFHAAALFCCSRRPIECRCARGDEHGCTVLGRAFLKEGREPHLGLLAALRDRRGQGFREIAAGRV
jgi:hypothetical protein